jgi:hypothetical protein
MPGSRNTQTSAETRSALDTSQQMQRYTLSPQYLQVHADTWSASHESQSMQIHTHPQQNTTNTVTRPSPLDTCRHSIQVHTALDTCQIMQTHAQPSTQANKCRYTPKPSRYMQAQHSGTHSTGYMPKHADTRSALDTSQQMQIHAQALSIRAGAACRYTLSTGYKSTDAYTCSPVNTSKRKRIHARHARLSIHAKKRLSIHAKRHKNDVTCIKDRILMYVSVRPARNHFCVTSVTRQTRH